MKIITITLRVPLTPTLLRAHIRTILNKINLNQYISIHTKFMVDKNMFPTRSLGYKHYLDLNNKEDIKNYLSYVRNLYNNKIKNGYKYNRITGLYIHCKVCNKVDYLNSKNELGNPIIKNYKTYKGKYSNRNIR